MKLSGIYLRELDRADLARINTWRADRELVDLLGANFRHVGAEIDNRWFDAYLGARTNNVRLAICRAADSALIGAVYLLEIDWVNRSAEFSIQIGEAEARGQGFGAAATRAALAHAFDDLNLHRVWLTLLASNARAESLYKKAGFEREGVLRDAAFKEGRYVDVVTMAILDSRRA